MNRSLRSVPDQTGDAELSIGDLAERVGITTATLRVWEARYGFPAPQRRASGHRRYTKRDVELVTEVLRRRDGGVRLDVAIDQVLDGRESKVVSAVVDGGSVFAQLRRNHPELMPHRFTKSTLLALSWAIEDEFCARAQRCHLFGTFQREPHFQRAAARWDELSRVSSSAYVFADFAETGGTRPVHVALREDSPMLREWSVICDSPELPVGLTAWELPGQQRTPDPKRVFEAIWTIDPGAVRDAARVCAAVAVEAGADQAERVASELAEPVTTTAIDTMSVTSLFNRAIAYVDVPPPR